jgi:hypothetical protein
MRETNLIFLPLASAFFLSWILWIPAYGQAESTSPKMTPEKVIRLTKKRIPIRTRVWELSSSPFWNSQLNQWEITVYHSKHSNKGECKYTNGCTVIKKLYVIIDDKKGKIISKQLMQYKYKNYE